MNIRLSKNAYGKNAVNLSKIIRHADHHEFRQISVNVSLEGDFDTAHTIGDNAKILPTDTQKNTVYALAKSHFNSGIEEFAMVLAAHFRDGNPQITKVTIEIEEHLYNRLIIHGAVHPHAFSSAGNEKHVTIVTNSEEGVSVSSGIRDLLILKTTDSGFENYIRDNYTTLKETGDRILATSCAATWQYNIADLDFTGSYNAIRSLLLETFAGHKSLSVQHTLHAMGEAVLKAYSEVKEISLVMPNKHHILFNLEQFGIENKNEIFIATDEPYGLISGTIARVISHE
jgi:urate oxidase